MIDPITLQLRYDSYAKSLGKSSEELLKDDINMIEFFVWVGKKSMEFKKLHPEIPADGIIQDQDAFTEFLEESVRGKEV